MIDRVAEAVRTALEGIQKDMREWSPNLTGACSVGSAALVRMLRRRGVSTVFVQGAYDHIQVIPGSVHCWVEVDDEVVDVTATQFNMDPEVAAKLSRVMALREWPRVYRSKGDFAYRAQRRGLAAARYVSDWEDDRKVLIARTVRVAERLLEG